MYNHTIAHDIKVNIVCAKVCIDKKKCKRDYISIRYRYETFSGAAK